MVLKNKVVFAFPRYETFVDRMRAHRVFEVGELLLHYFPDGESLVTLHTDVKDKEVVIVCGLENAATKILPLLFFADLAKELGAKSVGLVAPYLGYMRQDQRFAQGQAITSKSFATLLSSSFDSLVTLDPHLHRYKSLDEIYTIPTTVLHAAPLVGAWIKEHVRKPIIIGPDYESRQWVQEVAGSVDVPFIVLQKTRHGDEDVEISVPDVDSYKSYTPILVDDIISTAHTMIETVGHLRASGMKPPICIGIHAIFADGAYDKLKAAGIARVVTTNAIAHETNEIDVASLFAKP